MLVFSNVDNCILDGEMIGYDTKTKTFLTKDDNLDVKALGKDTATIEKYPNVRSFNLLAPYTTHNSHVVGTVLSSLGYSLP
jgi:hypothetical protein